MPRAPSPSLVPSRVRAHVHVHVYTRPPPAHVYTRPPPSRAYTPLLPPPPSLAYTPHDSTTHARSRDDDARAQSGAADAGAAVPARAISGAHGAATACDRARARAHETAVET